MISIIDYGLGNIHSFANLYKRLNLPFSIVKKKEDLVGSKKLILPGVGAFDHAMQLLDQSGMRDDIERLVKDEKIPILGICVGMQILAHSSEEGNLKGLSWIDGNVKKFETDNLKCKPYLPHMGWNTVTPAANNPLLKGINDGSRFYFLHSYYFECNNDSDVIASTEYGTRFTCAVNSDNVFGVQFHPEKSHQNGITVLKNFGEL